MSLSEEISTTVLELPDPQPDRVAAQRANLAKARAARAMKIAQKAEESAKNPRQQFAAMKQGEEAAQQQMEAEVLAASIKPMNAAARAENSGAIPEDFGIVQLGIEGIHDRKSMDRGKFSPPEGFDSDRFAIHWAARKPGTLDAWKSVAESQQPQKIEGTALTFPGWRVFHKPDGSEHTIAYGTGELVMMYTLRSHWDVINKATSQIAKNRGQAVKAKIQASELLLPSEVRQKEDREDEAYKAEILAMQRLAELST